MTQKTRMLFSGKAKSLYETDQPDLLITAFRDDTTAFDGEKHASLQGKGAVNLAISVYLMKQLAQHGVPTHLVEQRSETEIVVQRLKMIPVESVIRNIAAGSLCRRLGIEEGIALEPPIQEFYYKNDALHDPMINEDHIVRFGWATASHIQTIKHHTQQINDCLKSLFSAADLILVDAKFEFGLLDGKVVLGDEISPDSCRIWDKKTRKILDKDRFRKDLGDVIVSYREVAERLGVQLGE